MPDRTLHTGATTELWYELVRDGEARMHVRLPDDVESYLVFVLHRHQHDALLGGRTMALECLHGLELVGRARTDALRDVGDRCLLIAGLFPRLARRRNVQPGYYAALGQAAYGEVSLLARAGHAELFAQLARRFDAMRRVLGGIAARGTDVAEASGQACPLAVQSGTTAMH
ncbi:hypothetical protein ACFFGH_01770 [Lysobacter korlensis]|uniref:Uncharacterized protein n=1 Tax=Lysobacter korlensis TaxID=553636 RepID=A0ABV6RHX2_9GAMM